MSNILDFPSREQAITDAEAEARLKTLQIFTAPTTEAEQKGALLKTIIYLASALGRYEQLIYKHCEDSGEECVDLARDEIVISLVMANDCCVMFGKTYKEMKEAFECADCGQGV